jgi:dynein heavy chain, axonemal
MKKTIQARKNYQPLAEMASKLFFVLNDFNLINNMYQFSLESYKILFERNVVRIKDKTQAMNEPMPEKLNQIGELHKQEVYKYACRGLFEADKLLLSIQMAVALSKDID